MSLDWVSQGAKRLVQKVAFRVGKLTLGGSTYFCPLCNRSYRYFFRMGTPSRVNARCPGCGSLERHRLLWVALEHLYKSRGFAAEGLLLHVAAESCVGIRLREKYRCITMDLFESNVDVRTDLTNLCFSDGSFNAVVCNHVLEHIQDDRKALAEIFRVLKPGGWASLQVPIVGIQIHEDLSITEPSQRERLYGQSDHVRQYGLDFLMRVSAAGFVPLALSPSDFLSRNKIEKLSLGSESVIIFGQKPA